ncbi:transglutaminase domain-containing protein [Maribacter sp. 2-571]|uniref:transglutaminase domain-containing protein n=1 Tax=Maribacter sp. 2-571 TaxID=3417569 RepID=UPI003D352F24
MRQVFLRIAILLVGLPVLAQEYDHIDSKVKNYPDFSSIEQLSIRIQNDFDTDANRVRAAFVWLTHNIRYKYELDAVFAVAPEMLYYSEFGKRYQIERHQRKLIKKAFSKREGICNEYSLMFDYLCNDFSIPSKVILGLTKTDIMDVSGKRLVKNHSWNAVKIDGEWELLDATWGAGYYDNRLNKFVKRFSEHYYLTPPELFIKHHFPAKDSWQLLETPVGLHQFFSAPVYFPDYFEGRIKVMPNTVGLVKLTESNSSTFEFSAVADKQSIYYALADEGKLRKMRIRKKNQGFVSKIKFRKRLKKTTYLTIYAENKAVLNFKVKPNLKQ